MKRHLDILKVFTLNRVDKTYVQMLVNFDLNYSSNCSLITRIPQKLFTTKSTNSFQVFFD